MRGFWWGLGAGLGRAVAQLVWLVALGGVGYVLLQGVEFDQVVKFLSHGFR